jgi:hypothetical protein
MGEFRGWWVVGQGERLSMSMDVRELSERLEVGLAFCRGEVVEAIGPSRAHQWITADSVLVEHHLLDPLYEWRIKPRPKTRWVVKKPAHIVDMRDSYKELAFDTKEEAEAFAGVVGCPPPVEYVEVVK